MSQSQVLGIKTL